MFAVLLKAQPMSYVQPPFGPYTESKRLTSASGYFALMGLSVIPKSVLEPNTYSSLLFTISQAKSTKQCRQVARKIPDSSNAANVFFRTSALALRHRSTQLNSLERSGASTSQSSSYISTPDSAGGGCVFVMPIS